MKSGENNGYMFFEFTNPKLHILKIKNKKVICLVLKGYTFCKVLTHNDINQILIKQ